MILLPILPVAPSTTTFGDKCSGGAEIFSSTAKGIQLRKMIQREMTSKYIPNIYIMIYLPVSTTGGGSMTGFGFGLCGSSSGNNPAEILKWVEIRKGFWFFLAKKLS